MKRKIDNDEELAGSSPSLTAVHVLRSTRPRLQDTPSSSASHSYVATPARVGRLPIHSSPSAGPTAALLARSASENVQIMLRKRSLSLSSGASESSFKSRTVPESYAGTTTADPLDLDSESESDSINSISVSSSSLDEDEDSSDSSSGESEDSLSDTIEQDDSDSNSEVEVTAIRRGSHTIHVIRAPSSTSDSDSDTDSDSELDSDSDSDSEADSASDSEEEDSQDERMDDDIFGRAPRPRTTVVEGADGTTTLRIGSRPVIAQPQSSNLLNRLRSFMPEMENANRVLEEERVRGVLGDRIMEVGEDESVRCVEMNLGLGVLESRNNEIQTNEETMEDDEDEDTDVIGKLLARPETTQAFVQEV